MKFSRVVAAVSLLVACADETANDIFGLLGEVDSKESPFDFAQFANTDDVSGDSDANNSLFDFGESFALLQKGIEALGACGINWMEVACADFDDSNLSILNQFADYLEPLGADCDAAEAQQFTSALQDFESCAGFDLHDFLETFPSAGVGTLLECFRSSDLSGIEDWSSPEAFSKVKVSEKCLTFQYGHNAFGDGFRQVLLFPDQVSGCFELISDKIPDCSIGEWPIPLIGAWLKPATCLLGKSPMLYDELLTAQLKALDECLPNDIGQKQQCRTTCDDSVLVRLGDYSIPVSDAMNRLAKSNEFSSALARYEAYLSECMATWDGLTESISELDVVHRAAPLTSSPRALHSMVIFFGGFVAGAVILKLLLVSKPQKETKDTVELASLMSNSSLS